MSRKQIGWALGFFLFAAAGIRAQEPVAPQVQEPAQGGRRSAEGERGRGLFGKIGAIRADSIDITRADGATVTVKLGEKTEYRKGREAAKLADFKLGDSVFVRGEENADHTWTAQVIGARGASGPGGPGAGFVSAGMMGKDFLAGEVKQVNAPKITILRVDNVSQTIELNEDTSIRKGQESITLADLQPGDHVFARGAVQNEVFVPKMLVVVPPEQWKRMQEMGGFGQGGAKPATESPNPPQPQGPNW